MSPQEFEKYMTDSVKEFDDIATRANEIGKPARAKEFYDRARTYESILKVWRHIDYSRKPRFIVRTPAQINEQNGRDFSNY